MKSDCFDNREKVVTLQEAVTLAQTLKNKGKVIVTTNGSFDVLHVGHTRNLADARRLGDSLFVGVNSDESVTKNKGEGRPIITATERAELLSSLTCVDYVFIFDDTTPMSWLEHIKPNIHVKGGDYTPEIIEKDTVEAGGGKVVIVPHTGHSSTNIIKRIQSLR